MSRLNVNRISSMAVGIVGSLSLLPLAGCGGSAQVVTVTESATSAVTVTKESAETPLTADDRTWVDLIQSQNAAIDTFMAQLGDAGRSDATPWRDATIKMVRLREELNRAEFVGLSPCMQRVAVDWDCLLYTSPSPRD